MIMDKIIFDSKYFNVKDTLDCGQIFRYRPYKKGYLVFSSDKVCYAYNESEKAVIISDDKKYFYNFFDLSEDYGEIVNKALNCDCEAICQSSKLGKGIRILNQNRVETLFSFIVSQNNNIPRIKGIIEKMCFFLGEKKCAEIEGEKIEYFAFPKINELAKKDVGFFSSIGLGYRASYIERLAKDIDGGKNIEELDLLSTSDLKNRLLSIYGVGPKVADCVLLFGFHRTDSFPVDTWIEKVYHENMGGTLTDRNKIAKQLVCKYGELSGYFQQYLFYYKRSLEANE